MKLCEQRPFPKDECRFNFKHEPFINFHAIVILLKNKFFHAEIITKQVYFQILHHP